MPLGSLGVAAMVSQKAAAKSTQYSDTITLVAEAIAGDAATVNTWVMDTEANDPELVFVGEGLLSITSIIDPCQNEVYRGGLCLCGEPVLLHLCALRLG